jgi:hypothetical protein
MQLRTAVGAAVLAAALSFPLAGVAAAQTVTCQDFATQAAAQIAYNQNPALRQDLDLDRDGRACEAQPGRAPGTGEGADLDQGVTPTRGVATGAGGTAGERRELPEPPGSMSGVVLLAGGAALVAGGVVLARRRAVRRDG